MSSKSSGGTSVPTVLAIVFITLKLCGVIHWSWWWVLSPLWLTVAAVLAIALLVIAVKAIE
jgi:hypothetical protein